MQAFSNIPGAKIHMLCMCEKFSQVYIEYFYDIEQYVYEFRISDTICFHVLIFIYESENSYD